MGDNQSPVIPFISYEYQDEGLVTTFEALYREDILYEKSRDMGASWLACLAFAHQFQFERRRVSFLMVSRKEGLVDGDQDSLFAHIDFVLDHQPAWLAPPIRRKKLTFQNLRTGSVIEGESTTSNIGRGGRRGAILIDEFAAFEGGGWPVLGATRDSTDCRLFNSTPEGASNAFYAQRNRTRRERFHWSRHPEKALGLYRPTGAGFEILDWDYWRRLRSNDGRSFRHPLDQSKCYPFNCEVPQGEEGLRSVWYDLQCERTAHDVEIATQLDIDYYGSSYPFFDGRKLQELEEKFCTPPRGTYEADIDPETGIATLSLNPKGPFKIWCQFDKQGHPPEDRDYGVGADVSHGTGNSNSTLSFGDRVTGEKVAEFASSNVDPITFGKLAVALCKLFQGTTGKGALLCWEANGPGGSFRKSVVDQLSYRNVWYDTKEDGITPKVTDRPGWASRPDSKRTLLTQYRDDLGNGRFLNPSQFAIRECHEYIFTQSGKVEHSKSINSIDPSSAGDSHGDMVIADALCAMLMRERKRKLKKGGPKPTPGSFLQRRHDRMQETREARKKKRWKAGKGKVWR